MLKAGVLSILIALLVRRLRLAVLLFLLGLRLRVFLVVACARTWAAPATTTAGNRMIRTSGFRIAFGGLVELSRVTSKADFMTLGYSVRTSARCGRLACPGRPSP